MPDAWRTPTEILNRLGDFETYIGEIDDPDPDSRMVGRTWLNLPYGPHQRTFMTRMANHHDGTVFLGARTDTTLFQRYVFGHATAVLFLEGRIALLNPDGTPNKSSAAPRALAAYGEDDAWALRRSGLKGHFVLTEAVKRTGEMTLA